MSHSLLISEAFEIYRRDHIVYNNQSKKTEETHNLALKSYLLFANDKNIEHLTFQDIRSWKEHLDKKMGQNSVRGYVIKFRNVLGFLRKNNYHVLDPELVGIPKRRVTPVDFITEDEVKLLINASFAAQEGYSTHNRYRNRALISLLYASGIRVSELCRMNRSDIQKDGTFTVMGKGEKPRLCFLDIRAQIYIEEYLLHRDDNHPALFLSDLTKARVSVGTVQEIFRRARNKAGFTKPVHPHTMRHSFATNLLRNNTNLLYVKEFLGHTSVQTTEMYTHVVNEDLRRIYLEKHTL